MAAERRNPKRSAVRVLPPGRVADALPALPGTYLLCLRCKARSTIEIGRRGGLELRRGLYLYVGSARGPGGLAARLGRHLLGAGKRRWHIDYLRAATEPMGAWMAVSPSNQEHHWAAALAARAGLATVSDFGASDCRCRTHLFHARGWAEIADVAGTLSTDAAWFEV